MCQSGPTTPPIRVFISYSHDSEPHVSRVCALAASLRRDGVDCWIDQYEHDEPHEDWPLWMEKQIDRADFVLMVCTETYLRRVKGEEELGRGLGATFEAMLIRQALYEAQPANNKYIPVIFSLEDANFIPKPVRGRARYRLDVQSGYDKLYRRITDQPKVTAPPLGEIKTLGIVEPAQLFEAPKPSWLHNPFRNRVAAGVPLVMVALIVWFAWPRSDRAAEAFEAVESAFLDEHWATVITAAEEAEGVIPDSDTERRGWIALWRAWAYLFRGEVQHADQQAKLVRAEARNTGPLEHWGRYLGCLQDRLLGRLVPARNDLLVLLDRKITPDLPTDLRFEATLDLAMVETRRGQDDEAIRLLKTLGPDGDADEARRLRIDLARARVFYNQGKFEEAVNIVDDRESEWWKLTTRRQGMKAMLHGRCLLQLGKHPEAKAQLEEARQRFEPAEKEEKAEDAWSLFEVLTTLINAALNDANLTDAVEYFGDLRESPLYEHRSYDPTVGYLKSRTLLLALKNQRMKEVGTLLTPDKAPQTAIRELACAAVNQARNLGMLRMEVKGRRVLAILARFEEKPAQADFQYSRALDVAEQGWPHYAPNILLDRAGLRYEFQDLSGACEDTKRAIGILEESGISEKDHRIQGGKDWLSTNCGGTYKAPSWREVEATDWCTFGRGDSAMGRRN